MPDKGYIRVMRSFYFRVVKNKYAMSHIVRQIKVSQRLQSKMFKS